MRWETLGLQEQDTWNEVKDILESLPSLELLSQKDLEQIAMIKNQEGICLLWIALKQQVPLEVVYLLLEAGKESKVLMELIEKYLFEINIC
jgi:hypothetical protein